jgi:predicted kinase
MNTINTASHQELVLVRGHSGSGKSTFAASFVPFGYKHFENDSFFVGEDGVYTFDFAFHQVAKDECVKKAVQALLDGESVVVSNTFTKVVEMDSLVSFAQELGIAIRVFEMENNFENTHNVPEAVILEKKAAFESIEAAFKVKGDYVLV